MKLIRKFETSGKIPTKEEYISLKADERRQQAHANMLAVEKDPDKAVVPLFTPNGFKLANIKEYEDLKLKTDSVRKVLLNTKMLKLDSLLNNRYFLQDLLEASSKRIKDLLLEKIDIKFGKFRNYSTLEHLEKIDAIDKLIEKEKLVYDDLLNREDYNNYYHNRELVLEEYELAALNAGVPLSGLACISNVLHPYGIDNIFSNKAFINNAQKLGFKRIPITDVLPGDIYNNISHGVMVDLIKNGRLLVNLSHGEGPLAFHDDAFTEDVETLSKKESDKDLFNWRAWRFVGSPLDSLRWAKEWYNKYKEK